MISISQPTYLPWHGYFSLIDKSSKFIFLDDVQFDKRSWQQRNKILINNKEKFLTVPVKSKGSRFQKICEVKINDENFYEKHIKTIKQNYSKTDYFSKYFPIMESFKSSIKSIKNLSEINIFLIIKISELLGIKKDFVKSSSLRINKKRTEKLVEICEKFKHREYLTNIGAKNYILEDKIYFLEKNINVNILNYESKKYTQQNKIFLDKLSILDLLFNEGPNSLNIIRNSTNLSSLRLV